MDATEIKQEFPNCERMCYVCFSVGRKLSPLGDFISVFKNIISDLDYQVSITIL